MKYPLIYKYEKFLSGESDAGIASIKSYVTEIQKFLRWLHQGHTPRTDQRLLEIDGRRVEEYFAFLVEKGISYNTRRSYIKTAINQFYRFAWRKGKIPHKLEYEIRYPKSDREKHKVVKYLEDEHISKIREYVRTRPLRFETPGDQYRKQEKVVIIETLIETGARIGEVINLTKSDIIEHKHRIVFNQKTGYRETPVKRDSNLFEQINQLTSMYIYTFSRASDKIFHISDEGVRMFLRRMEHEIGIRLHPHLFRHYRATQLCDAGLPVKIVAQMMGMSVKTVLDVYHQVTDDSAQKVYDQWQNGQVNRVIDIL